MSNDQDVIVIQERLLNGKKSSPFILPVIKRTSKIITTPEMFSMGIRSARANELKAKVVTWDVESGRIRYPTVANKYVIQKENTDD